MLQKGPRDCRYAPAHNLKVNLQGTRKVPLYYPAVFHIKHYTYYLCVPSSLKQTKYTHSFNFKSFLKASVFNTQFPSNNFIFHANIAITCRHIITQFQQAAATTTAAPTTRP